MEHETTWLMLAGFLLRPGYGYFGDRERINELWRIFTIGISYRKEPRVLIQWCVLWRRVSGGLNADQQEAIFDQLSKEMEKNESIRKEAYRTLSVLELVSIEKKESFARFLVRELANGKIDEAVAWSFGRISSRTLLDSGGTVVSPKIIEECLINLENFSWKEDRFLPLAKAMLLAGRVVGKQGLNVSPELRLRISKKVSESSLGGKFSLIFKEYIPIEPEELSILNGEDLPLGLELDINRSQSSEAS